jgi:flavodoxin
MGVKMKKAIVYYSKTGNTKMIANRFEDFDLLEVKAISDDPNQKNLTLVNPPKIDTYDYVIFASPVHGFQLSKIMAAYLNQLEHLDSKLIDLYITHFFPFAWMGGNQTLKQMKKIIKSKGGEVRYKFSINWSRKNKDLMIKEMIDLCHE